MLPKSSPKLTRIPSLLSFFLSFFYFVTSIPSFFFFHRPRLLPFTHSALGLVGFGGTGLVAFYLYFLHLEILSPRLQKTFASPSFFPPSTSYQVTRLPFSILHTHTQPHTLRETGALNVRWRSQFSASSNRESVSQKKVRQTQGSDET